MKCKFCDEPNSIHCDDACDFHLQASSNALLKCFMNYAGMKPIPGTDRYMFQCAVCQVYELAPRMVVNEKGLIEEVETGKNIVHIEEVGWRKIGGKWECFDCLAGESDDN